MSGDNCCVIRVISREFGRQILLRHSRATSWCTERGRERLDTSHEVLQVSSSCRCGGWREAPQGATTALPGVLDDGNTSHMSKHRQSHTFHDGESPQRALQACNENALQGSDVENSCDRGRHANTAPHGPTALRNSSKLGPYAGRAARRDQFLYRIQR